MSLPTWLQPIEGFIEHSAKQIILFTAYSVWEWWLGKTKKTVSASTIQLLGKFFKWVGRILTGKGKVVMVPDEANPSVPPVSPEVPAAPLENVVDKEIKLGEIGEIEFDFHNGLAMVEISAKAPDGIASGGAFIKVDAIKFAQKVVEALNKKLPPALLPLADGLEQIMISAIKAIP